MKPATLIVVATLLAVGAAALTSSIVTPGDAAEPRLAELSSEIDGLGDQLVALQGDQARLLETLETLQRSIATLPSASADVVSLGDIERAVEGSLRKLRERGVDVALGLGDDAGLGVELASATEPKPTVEDYLQRLAAAGDNWEDGERIWNEIAEAGLLDDVVAMFEKLAAEDPYDPELQLVLGVAYLQKTQEAGAGPEAGLWASKADQAFDATLALDETNWDARFTKAVALSFWPPIFGKQGEAISQFEVLLDQQRGRPVLPQHSQTYLMLGNMYQQLGRHDQALATWAEGYELFPDMKEFETQIKNAN